MPRWRLRLPRIGLVLLFVTRHSPKDLPKSLNGGMFSMYYNFKELISTSIYLEIVRVETEQLNKRHRPSGDLAPSVVNLLLFPPAHLCGRCTVHS